MQIKDFINNLNRYYWKIIQERNYPNGLKLPDKKVDSLIHFCGYAFERAGSPKIYQEAAIEVFKKERDRLEGENSWSNDIEGKLLSLFESYCEGEEVHKFNKKK